MDLYHFYFNEIEFSILAIVLDEDLKSIVAAVFCHKPAGTFGEENHEAELEQWRGHLEKRRDSPAPVVEDSIRTEAYSCSGDLADEV